MAASSEIHIHRLSPEDAASFHALRLRALSEHPAAFGSSYEEEAARQVEALRERFERDRASGDFILGAFTSEDGLAGVVGFRRAGSKKMRHKGHIWGMYVAGEHQGRGIGRRILEEAIAQAKATQGLEQLHLAVVLSNEKARRLYESLGFRTFGIEPRALKVEEVYYDEAYMWLDLKRYQSSRLGTRSGEITPD